MGFEMPLSMSIIQRNAVSTSESVTCKLGLLRVSEYSDICGSEYKIEYEYSSLPKLLDRNFFFFLIFFLPFLLLKQEVFHKMVH